VSTAGRRPRRAGLGTGYAILALLGALALPVDPAAARTLAVTSNADSGQGTLRAAIQEANRDAAVDRIAIRAGVRLIALESSVTYSGAQALTLDGGDATITESGAGDLFVATGGGDLVFRNIRFANARKSAVVVNVPAGEAVRWQKVTLRGVHLDRNGHYGLHVDDQAGGDGAGADSAASVQLTVVDSVVSRNNNPDIDREAADKDGIRLDEGGPGHVAATIVNSTLDRNAAEGIEIDETGPGDVVVNATSSTFSNNGDQPQAPDDLEDGLDVDESGPGDIRLSLIDSAINANRDEGLDVDGADAGDIVVTAINLIVAGNQDDNVKLTLLSHGAAAGIIRANFIAVTAVDSVDGDGLRAEALDNADDETPAGASQVRITSSLVADNAGDDVQIDAADGALQVRDSRVGETDLSDSVERIPE
jgi:hypothetical protein